VHIFGASSFDPLHVADQAGAYADGKVTDAGVKKLTYPEWGMLCKIDGNIEK
jgi:hypothetical protein